MVCRFTTPMQSHLHNKSVWIRESYNNFGIVRLPGTDEVSSMKVYSMLEQYHCYPFSFCSLYHDWACRAENIQGHILYYYIVTCEATRLNGESR